MRCGLPPDGESGRRRKMKNPSARLPPAKQRRDERDQLLPWYHPHLPHPHGLRPWRVTCRSDERRLPGTVTCASRFSLLDVRLRTSLACLHAGRSSEHRSGKQLRGDIADQRDYGAGLSNSWRSLDIRALSASSPSLPFLPFTCFTLKLIICTRWKIVKEIRR